MPASYSNVGEMSGPVLKAYVKLMGQEEVNKSMKEMEAQGVKSFEKIGEEVKKTETNLQTLGTKLSVLGSKLTQYFTLPIVGIGTAAVVSTMKLFEMEGVTDRMTTKGRDDFHKLEIATAGFKDEVIDTRVEIAEALSPVMTTFLTDVATPLVDTLGKLAQKWGEQSEEAKLAQVEIAGVVALGGPIVSWAADVVIAVAAAKIAFAELKITVALLYPEIAALLLLIGGAKAAMSLIPESDVVTYRGNIPGISSAYGRDFPLKTPYELAYDKLGLKDFPGSAVADYLRSGDFTPGIKTPPLGGGGRGRVPTMERGSFDSGLYRGNIPDFNEPLIERWRAQRDERGYFYNYNYPDLPETMGAGIRGKPQFSPEFYGMIRQGRREYIAGVKGEVMAGQPQPGQPSPWTSENIWGLVGSTAQGAIQGGGAGAISSLFAGVGAMVGGPAGMFLGLAGGLLGSLGKSRGQTPQEPAYVKVINPSDIATALLNKGFLSAMAAVNMDTLVQQVHLQNAERNLA